MTKPRCFLVLACAMVALAGCAKATAPGTNGVPRHGHADDMEGHAVLGEGKAEGLDGDDHFPFRKRAPQPAPAGRPGAWLAFSNHNHSTYWDGKKPLTVMQQEAYLRNLDAFALTDHNTMRGTSSHEFRNPPPGLLMVKGMEWNAFREKGEEVVGHAGLLGMKGDEGIRTGLGLEPMLEEATRREATIVINHPFTKGNTWAQPKPDPRAHAIEVWNGWWYRAKPIIQNDKALGWWDEALRDGRKLTALSGTDNHGQWYDDIARNVNMVFAETPDEAGILKGIREGRVTLTQSPTAARLYLEADADGDGTYEAMIGDEVARPATGTLAVRARVLGGKGKKVVFYTASGKAAVADVASDDASVPLAVALRPGADFVRAELRKSPRLPWSMTAIANPIYVR